MDARRIGDAALSGWRRKVAGAVAGPVSRHSRLDRSSVEQLVGAAFLALASLYVVRTSARVLRGR